MKTLTVLFFFHCCAIVLGLIGLLVMLPHPQIWDETASGIAVFNFNMKYMSSLYILLGAAMMLLYGLRFVGVRKTLIFFGASTLISLSLELLGTSTGFPFGPYAYTNLLGFKILGHVPYAIPLSWFYMGFTSYLLANLLVVRGGWRRQTLWALLLGAAFLTVWDLSLDPSMASPRLSVQFWTWYTGGFYFGMPIRNLVGWSITGLLFMSVSRLLWRGNVDTRRLVAWLPCGVYAANTCFAIALTLGAGIWQPSILALLLGLLPTALVLRLARRGAESAGDLSLSRRISHLVVRWGSAAIVRRHITSEIIGAENIPQNGPVMIVARHFHHLYDGCLLLQATPRRLHLLVALDWVRHSLWRCVIEHLCNAVDWPMMLRGERLKLADTQGEQSAYRRDEARGYMRRASAQAIQLLRQGEALVIFPEAYPVIDPVPSPRAATAVFLPFRPGFARLLAWAEKDSQTHVALVPAGLWYTLQNGRWQVTLRFGPPLSRQDFASPGECIRAIEQRVRELSLRECPSVPPQAPREREKTR